MGAVLKTCQTHQPVSHISQPPELKKSTIDSKIVTNPEPIEPPIREPAPVPPVIEPPFDPRSGSRSGSTSLENSIEKKCIYCQKKKQEQDFIKTECKGFQCFYHKGCFEEQLRVLIQNNKFIIKCKCGTKMNTSFLRSCSIPERMNLLTRLFEKQLDEIRYSTKAIRNDSEAQECIDNNRLASELNDYFLIPQETLEYEETPQ